MSAQGLQSGWSAGIKSHLSICNVPLMTDKLLSLYIAGLPFGDNSIFTFGL